MSLEEWRPIPGFEGAYEVSDLGRVRSLERHVRLVTRQAGETRRRVSPRILRPGPSSTGHLSVALGKSNSKGVHTLVMRAFVGEPPQGMEVRHRDGNPANNCLFNLQYGTRSENNKDTTLHGRRKLTPEQVRNIKARAEKGFAYGDRYQLALKLGVNPGTIYKILTGDQYDIVV